MDEIVFPTEEEFWTHIRNSIRPEIGVVWTEQNVNSLFVRFIKTVADHVHIYVNDDQDIYRCGLHLIHSELYESNRLFCIGKILSFLNVTILDINMKFVASYILLLDSKNDSSLLELVQELNGFEVLYNSLSECFGSLSILNKDTSEIGTIQTIKQVCTIQLDILFQLCKYLSIPSKDLLLIDAFFISYIFESLIVAYNEEDVFNAAKFKFILAVNEQFMIASRNDHIINKVFETLSTHKTSSNFNECLLVYFNREDDKCLKIMISKILYLIFNDEKTQDMFYHNDLNVLVDVLIRELTDLSEDDESLRNTFLRVLYPILKNKQFQSTLYKKDELKNLLLDLSGDSNSTFWTQSDTTKRLASRCLNLDWIKKDEHELPTLHLTNSNTSTVSVNSMSKKPPPPPQPRKQLSHVRQHLYSTPSTNGLR